MTKSARIFVLAVGAGSWIAICLIGINEGNWWKALVGFLAAIILLSLYVHLTVKEKQ